jgi:hypothetical protein
MSVSRLTLRKQTYLGWPAWQIQQGPLELMLIPQVGGRVMRFAWEGENLLFTHPDFRGCIEPIDQVEDVHVAKRQMGFRLWGGEKTWLAPQDRWTDGVPFLDLDSGAYTIDIVADTAEQVCVRMTSPVCRETGVQIVRTVTVRGEQACVQVAHELVNTSSHPVTWGLWSVSQFLKPASVYLPRGHHSCHPDGVKTFIEEGQSSQVRAQMVQAIGGLAQIRCQDAVAFKFGVDATEGWLFSICDRPDHGPIGYLTTYPVFANQPYGHACSAEVYNSDHLPYFEIEVHSPLLCLAPGERAGFQELRRLFTLTTPLYTEEAIRARLAFSCSRAGMEPINRCPFPNNDRWLP